MRKEIQDIHNDEVSKITVSHGDDIMHLKGSFQGPPGTPYEGGTYQIDITIPNEYPFRPPVMKFDTKVWHPNVSSQTVSPEGGLSSFSLTIDRGLSVSTHCPRPGRLYLL